MANERKYMVDLPDASRPGEFHSEGPLSADGVLGYLHQWYPGVSKAVLFDVFVTELAGEGAGEGAEETRPGPRYTHPERDDIYQGQDGRYDVYFRRDVEGEPRYDLVLLRCGDDPGAYEARFRFTFEERLVKVLDAPIYDRVFARYPGEAQ